MTKIEEVIQGKAPLYALIALLTGGGGFNVLSETAEEKERDTVIQKFEDADYIQNTKFEALLALTNELRIQVAVLQEKIGE